MRAELLPSQYDDAGTLAADLGAFVELRLVQAANARHQPNGGVAALSAPPEEGLELGPSTWSRLGPPIPAQGGWASLYHQLQERKQQLAEQQQPKPAAAANGTPAAAAKRGQASAARGSKSAPPPSSKRGGGQGEAREQQGAKARSLTPGATRPRAGVRLSALGPMLRMLREGSEQQS